MVMQPKGLAKAKRLGKADRLVEAACREEIEAVAKACRRPVSRATWLAGRRWYGFNRARMVALGCKGKIPRFPRHAPRKEAEDGKPEDVG